MSRDDSKATAWTDIEGFAAFMEKRPDLAGSSDATRITAYLMDEIRNLRVRVQKLEDQNVRF